MKSITTLENIPDSLDIQEMMDVKGGAEINANICLLAAAVKCTVAGAGTCTTKGSGTIVIQPNPSPNPGLPTEPGH